MAQEARVGWDQRRGPVTSALGKREMRGVMTQVGLLVSS